jgi:hypothetical protein
VKPEHWIGALGVAATLTAAVAGTWIGGSIASRSARDLQREQADREEQRAMDRTRAAARGAARVYVQQFQEGFVIVNDSLAYKKVLVPRRYPVVEIALEDRKLIASSVQTDQWAAVSDAEAWLLGAFRPDRAAIREARKGVAKPALSSNRCTRYKRGRGLITSAIQSLSGLIGSAAVNEPVVAIKCESLRP